MAKYYVGGGDPNPVIYLTVSGSLTKTQITGEAVDLTGLVFTAHHLNGSTEVVTNKVKTSRAVWGSKAGTQKIEVGYKNNKVVLTVNVEALTLVSIEVKTPPTKTAYKVGETINMTGLVLTASFNDGTSEDVTEGYTFTPDTMASDTAKVTISYTVGEVTKTAEQSITLISLDSIAVTTPPTETEFAEGADIDLTGMVVTATYTDTSTEEVTGYTFAPTVMASDTTEVTISYTESGVTKTTTQAVTLKTVE